MRLNGILPVNRVQTCRALASIWPMCRRYSAPRSSRYHSHRHIFSQKYSRELTVDIPACKASKGFGDPSPIQVLSYQPMSVNAERLNSILNSRVVLAFRAFDLVQCLMQNPKNIGKDWYYGANLEEFEVCLVWPVDSVQCSGCHLLSPS